MAEALDVYRDWLGIKEPERPLNYYQLLRTKQFEDDAVKIRAHYRKLNAHVRKYATGDYAEESQALLNELAKAMLCLTDAKRKVEYDASLGREDDGPRRRSMDELLILRKVVDQEQLAKARKFADAVGLELRDALVQQKLAKPEVVTQIFAEAEGIPYVDLDDLGVAEEMIDKVPAVVARQHSCAPVMVDDGQLLVASPNPLDPTVEDDLRLRVGMPVRSLLCTSSGINAVVAKYYPKEKAAAEMAAGGPAAVGQNTAETTAASSGGTAAAPLSAEERKAQKRQRNMVTLMAFNFTFMALMLYLLVFTAPPWSLFVALPIAAGAGAIVAGTAHVAQSLRS